MKLRIFGLLLALALLSGLYGCEQIKELTGQGEAKKEEGSAEEGGNAEATKKAEAATAVAEKATAAAEQAAAEAKAEVEKAKAEAEEAKAETEKTKADAEDAKTRIEDKAKRQSLTKDLAEFTAEALNLKNQVKVAKDAWGKVSDTERVGILDEVLEDLGGLETERTVVEGLMVQGKLDEARTKLEVVKAKFPAVKQKAAPTLAEKPVDPVQWKAMLDILAEETCLTKRNLPAQEFQAAREQLFTRYALDRVVYEQLRAQFNQKPAQEDQGYLSQKVTEVCARPVETPPGGAAGGEIATAEAGATIEPEEVEGEVVGEAATEEAVTKETEEGTGEATEEEIAAADAKASEAAEAEKAAEEKAAAVKAAEEKAAEEKKAEEKKAEEKKAEEKEAPATFSGKFSGKLLVPGKKGSTIALTLKENKAKGKARIGGVNLKLSGTFKKGQGKLTGKGGKTNISCQCRATSGRVTGKCSGKINGAPFKNARFTAR